MRPTDPRALPDGPATYSGVVFVEQEASPMPIQYENAVVDGDMEPDFTTFAAVGTTIMNADFDTMSVTGTASNFVEIDNPDASIGDYDGQAIGGTLTSVFNEGRQQLGTIEVRDPSPVGMMEGRFLGSLNATDGSTIMVNESALGGFVGEGAIGFVASTFMNDVYYEGDFEKMPFVETKEDLPFMGVQQTFTDVTMFGTRTSSTSN